MHRQIRESLPVGSSMQHVRDVEGGAAGLVSRGARTAVLLHRQAATGGSRQEEEDISSEE